ncbi:hypothetical protein Tcan_02862 [Toxocara canis]|uniref:Uncharacterized protein n=1 Tax=Toxocara canis TaxID=6265 RepID=A0A0B2VAE4_TOXCA|nr:hypothetical protein Tcan_02862 [Toxocara canis]
MMRVSQNKISNIVFVFKTSAVFKNTGSEQEPANYWPISLLSCASKLSERCTHPQIYQTLEPFLPKCQHAFRRRHSITTAVAVICEKILLNIENSNLTGIVQCRTLQEETRQYGTTGMKTSPGLSKADCLPMSQAMTR